MASAIARPVIPDRSLTKLGNGSAGSFGPKPFCMCCRWVVASCIGWSRRLHREPMAHISSSGRNDPRSSPTACKCRLTMEFADIPDGSSRCWWLRSPTIAIEPKRCSNRDHRRRRHERLPCPSGALQLSGREPPCGSSRRLAGAAPRRSGQICDLPRRPHGAVSGLVGSGPEERAGRQDGIRGHWEKSRNFYKLIEILYSGLRPTGTPLGFCSNMISILEYD
jgi:hypothetical protein